MDNTTMGGTSAPGTPTPRMNMTQEPQKKSIGPVIGLIIILAIIVLGSLYFWSTRTAQAPGATQTTQENGSPLTPEEIRAQGSSSEVTDIETDLNGFDENDINNINSNIE